MGAKGSLQGCFGSYVGARHAVWQGIPRKPGSVSLPLESCSVTLGWRRRRCFVGPTRQRKGYGTRLSVKERRRGEDVCAWAERWAERKSWAARDIGLGRARFWAAMLNPREGEALFVLFFFLFFFQSHFQIEFQVQLNSNQRNQHNIKYAPA